MYTHYIYLPLHVLHTKAAVSSLKLEASFPSTIEQYIQKKAQLNAEKKTVDSQQDILVLYDNISENQHGLEFDMETITYTIIHEIWNRY